MIATTTTEALAQVNTLASHTALSAWSSASDFLIILVLVGFFFCYAWYVGRGPFVAIILSYYGAYAIYATFPYANLLPTAPALTAFLAHVGVYVAFGFAFYVILRRVVVSDFFALSNLALIILSFFASAFLIAIAYHLFSVASVYQFTPAIQNLFGPDKYFFWWFSAPAIALFLLAR